jgi:deoxyribonuclease V
MHPSLHHGWDLSRDAARRLQQTLATEVLREDDLPDVRSVAGVHLGYPRTASGAVTGQATVVVLSLPELELVEQRVAIRSVTFPYIPGLRSFRETPLALAALEQLAKMPDLLLIDGHGVAHPQRFGVASHIGLLLDMPTVGCSTTVPVGVAMDPDAEPGAWSPLTDNQEIIGAALRTRPGSRPIYVSTGHRISLETAIGAVLTCTRGYRQPEPLRLAARLATDHSMRGTTAP